MTAKVVVEPPGKCFWCSLNNGNGGPPAYRVIRDLGDFKREADICEKCFNAFGGFSLESLKVIDVYPEPFEE